MEFKPTRSPDGYKCLIVVVIAFGGFCLAWGFTRIDRETPAILDELQTPTVEEITKCVDQLKSKTKTPDTDFIDCDDLFLIGAPAASYSDIFARATSIDPNATSVDPNRRVIVYAFGPGRKEGDRVLTVAVDLRTRRILSAKTWGIHR